MLHRWACTLAIGCCVVLGAPIRAGAQDRPTDQYRIDWQLAFPFRLFKPPAPSEAATLYENPQAFETSWAPLRDLYVRPGCVNEEQPVLCSENYTGPVRLAAYRRYLHPSLRGTPNNNKTHRAFVGAVTRYNADSKLNDNLVQAPGSGTHAVLVSLQHRDGSEWKNVTGDCSWTVDGSAVSGPCSGMRAQFTRTYGSPTASGSSLSVNFVPATGGAALTLSLGGADTRIEEHLIVGLGDSFASGEGNPDVPFLGEKGKVTADGWPKRLPPGKQSEFQIAHWLDRQCHRSLLSSQTRAVMHLAARYPRREFTFVGLACSGATIVKGILWSHGGVEQTELSDRSRRGDFELHWSQINALFRELCADYDPAPARAKTQESNPWLRDPKEPSTKEIEQHIFPCTRGMRRPVDAILLSVGGNDIGFTMLATWTLTRSLQSETIGDILKNSHHLLEPQEALHNIRSTNPGSLSDRYGVLNRILGKHFPNVPVIISAYPSLLRGRATEIGHGGDQFPLCDTTNNSPNVGTGFEYISTALGISTKLDISEETSRQTEAVIDALNELVMRKRPAWVSAASHLAAFRRPPTKTSASRGICVNNCRPPPGHDKQFACTTIGGVELEGSHLPNQIKRYDVFNAFALTRRFFRTPNDTRVVINTLPTYGDFVQKGSPCRSGPGFIRTTCEKILGALTPVFSSIHPNSYGAAAIADAYVVELKHALRL